MKVYCKLCGNEPVDDLKTPCADCRKVVEGPLAKAYALFNEACDRYSKCCGRLTSDKSHLYFHGKGWEDNYEAVSSDGERIDDRGVGVDYGIVFYPDYARAYYMTEMTSVEYGLRLDNRSYEQGTFWSHVEFMLGQAAKRAYDDGFRTCGNCGRTACDNLYACPCADDVDEEDSPDKAQEDSPSYVTSGDQRRTLAVMEDGTWEGIESVCLLGTTVSQVNQMIEDDTSPTDLTGNPLCIPLAVIVDFWNKHHPNEQLALYAGEEG